MSRPASGWTGGGRVFDDELSAMDAADRAALEPIIELVGELVPEATAGRSYGMPAFRYRDRPLLGFAVHAAHLGLYPFSPDALDSVADQLEGFERSKGAVRFTAERPLPTAAVAAMVRARAAEIEATT